MKTAFLACAVALVAACVAPQTSAGGGGAVVNGAGADAGDASAAIATDGGSATVTGCTTQTTGGTMLCAHVSLCPSLGVDPTRFDQCGFVLKGESIDLECECSGYLCSAGATSCVSAGTILDNESSIEVCNRLSAGGCVLETTGGGSGSGASACSATCSSQCVGDPVCLQACGC